MYAYIYIYIQLHSTDNLHAFNLILLQGINITLPDCCDCSLHSASVKAVMDHFNKTCKTFTAINAFKYQLQHYLFHDRNSATLPAEYVVQQLTSLITGLQTAAKHLQEIAINEVIAT